MTPCTPDGRSASAKQQQQQQLLGAEGKDSTLDAVMAPLTAGMKKAVMMGKTQEINERLTKGEHPDACISGDGSGSDTRGLTALMIAAQLGEEKALQLLLAVGAQLDRQDNHPGSDGRTAVSGSPVIL